MSRVRLVPGRRWRVRANDGDGEEVEVVNVGTFDELVVDGWFHLEAMDKRSWLLVVETPTGQVILALVVGRDGKARVYLTDGALSGKGADPHEIVGSVGEVRRDGGAADYSPPVPDPE